MTRYTRMGLIRDGLVTIVATPADLTANGGWWTAKDTSSGDKPYKRDIARAHREGMRLGPPAALKPAPKVNLDKLYPRPRWMVRAIAHGLNASREVTYLGWDVPLTVKAVPDMTDAERRAALAREARRLAGEPLDLTDMDTN